jgi:hypothetical protein
MISLHPPRQSTLLRMITFWFAALCNVLAFSTLARSLANNIERELNLLVKCGTFPGGSRSAVLRNSVVMGETCDKSPLLCDSCAVVCSILSSGATRNTLLQSYKVWVLSESLWLIHRMTPCVFLSAVCECVCLVHGRASCCVTTRPCSVHSQTGMSWLVSVRRGSLWREEA